MTNVGSPLRVIQTDFRSGEVDPLLYMRVDSKMYPSGAKSLRNCILRAGGAVSRRPGSTRLAALASQRNLISFEYDADEKYILAFGAAALAIYDGTGSLVTSFSGSTDCPWSTYQIASEMTFAQAGDTMVICHSSFQPKILRRTSLTTFAMSTFAFDAAPNNALIYQPYIKFAAADVTLTVSSASVGTGRTVTASSAIFSSAWVGETIRVLGSELTITGYTSTTVVTASVKKAVQRRLDPNPFLSQEASKVIEVTHPYHGLVSGVSVTVSGAIGGLVTTFVYAEINGSFTVTVIDEDRYTITSTSADNANISADFGGPNVTITTTAATRDWEEQTFNARRGWPSACAFHEDRLWLGGSTTLPDGLFSSKTGLYYNFDVGEGEDDASIQTTLGSPRVARIKNILAGSVLQIFTEGAEFVAKQSDGVGLTPATISIRPQTPYGSGKIRPRAFDGATLFVQGNGKTVREFDYVDASDGFQAVDITTLSQHLITEVVSMDVLYGSNTRTEQYAFLVNDDGTMAVFHSNRGEGLAGWVPWETAPGHLFESVCVLGSNLYVSTLRGTDRWLEKIELDNPDVTLDWAVTQSGAASTSWSLTSVYASQTLEVTSNDYYLGTVVANGSGVITTPASVTTITAGLNFDFEVIPLSPDMQLPDGPMTGEKRRISSAIIHVHDSLSLAVDGRSVVTTQIGADLSVAPARISRKIRRFLLGYDRDPVVTLSQLAPLPVTILGMTMEISL
jgi:hypothetical protein